MNRIRKSGFSLLEVIAAVVILSVVAAATVATVTPMRAKSHDKRADREITTLNAMTQTYHQEEGRFPLDASELTTSGYVPTGTTAEKAFVYRIQRHYRYSPNSGTFSKK